MRSHTRPMARPNFPGLYFFLELVSKQKRARSDVIFRPKQGLRVTYRVRLLVSSYNFTSTVAFLRLVQRIITCRLFVFEEVRVTISSLLDIFKAVNRSVPPIYGLQRKQNYRICIVECHSVSASALRHFEFGMSRPISKDKFNSNLNLI